MRPDRFEDIPCSVARATGLLGDPWIPMILRECAYGVARFDDYRQRLNIGRNVLSARLERMVETGLLEKWTYQERPRREGYRLTPKGRGAMSVIAAMLRFANDWVFEEGQEPIVLRDLRDGRALRPVVVDEETGEPLSAIPMRPSPGPGFPGDETFQREWFNPAPPGDAVSTDSPAPNPDGG
ncbi:MAG: helix-turn-helix domain-containing protein [Myxococcota bacterium]